MSLPQEGQTGMYAPPSSMPQPQIEYAPVLPSEKRRRVFRRITFGIIAVLILLLAIKSAPLAWRHVEILYWQHRAMAYSAPADQIVYDDDPSDAARLRASNPSLLSDPAGGLFDFASPWDEFYQLISPPGRRPAATLFVHERINGHGERRLLVIELCPTSPVVGSPSLKTFQIQVFAPGGLFDLPRERTCPEPGGPLIGSRRFVGDRTKWYAGQADPSDGSHFTIRGRRDGAPVTVEGWLRDDFVELNESP